jgi:hypothetical protein
MKKTLLVLTFVNLACGNAVLAAICAAGWFVLPVDMRGRGTTEVSL